MPHVADIAGAKADYDADMPGTQFATTKHDQVWHAVQSRLGHITAKKWLIIVAASVPCAALAGILVGAVAISPAEAITVLWLHLTGAQVPTDLAVVDTILTVTRIPRVLTAMGAGAVLAVAGAALQAMVRNPLADPYVLGISSGASAGAAAAIAFGFSGVLGALALPAVAFIGAIVATVMVLVMAGGSARATPLRLVLVGIAVGYGFSALTNIVVFLSATPEATRAVMFWMLGALATASWSKAALVGAAALLLACAVLPRHRDLDALAAGDRTALSVGVDPRRVRIRHMLVISLAIALTVSATGGIGFVGLVIPHFARAMVGVRHRLVLPATAMLGASVLIVADLIARTVFAPMELPIGVLTGLLGAPMILYIVQSRRNGVAA